MSQWANLPMLDMAISRQDNGFPTAAFWMNSKLPPNPVHDICVIKGSGVLADNDKLGQFFEHYYETQSPLVTVSSSKTHPYWTKRDVDGQIVSVFPGANYGQRQLLPERYVEDSMAVIANENSIRSANMTPLGHKWSEDRSIVVNCAFTYAEAHVLHTQETSDKVE